MVVSVHKGSTWSRRLSDGRVVGRLGVAARKGSRCTPDGHILIAGRRDVAIYDGPRFRRLWRHAVGSLIKDVALCGTRITMLLSNDSSLATIDLPQAEGAPGPR